MHRGLRLLLLPLLFIPISLFPRLWVDREPIDDAYITFRHSVRLREGLGWEFNDSSRVIATTTPLWTMVLVPLSTGLPDSAEVLSITLDCLVPIVLYFIAVQTGLSVLWCTFAALFYALSPDPVLCAPAGMEIPLFNLLLGLSVLFLQKRRQTPAAICAGLLAIVRPEGILVAVLVEVEGFRQSWRPSRYVLLGLPLAVWAAFTTVFHRCQIIPGSLQGKLNAYGMYPEPLGDRFLAVLEYIGSLFYKMVEKDPWQTAPKGILFLLLFAIGVRVLIRRRDPAWILPVFSFLFLIGCGLVRVPLFSWYFCLPTVGISLVLAVSLAGLRDLVPSKPRFLAVCSVLFALGLLAGGAGAIWSWNTVPSSWLARTLFENDRERSLHRLADALKASLEAEPMRATPSILVHDLGVIGFRFPQAFMIDSAAIASPEVGAWYRRHPDIPGFKLTRELIEAMDPDFLVTTSYHGPVNAEGWDWLHGHYREVGRVEEFGWASPYAAVFRRRIPGPAL